MRQLRQVGSVFVLHDLLLLLPVVFSPFALLRANALSSSPSSRALLPAPLWTAIPPSSNPKSKLNQDFLRELHDLPSNVTKVEVGRVWFHLPDANDKPDGDTSISLSKLTNLNARSIRLVWLEMKDLDNVVTSGDDPQSEIVNILCENRNAMLKLLETIWVQAAGNTLSLDDDSASVSFSLSCKKWQDFAYPNWSTSDLCNRIARQLTETLRWQRVPKSKKPTLQLNILLYESTFQLEMTALTQPIVMDELPQPGMKRIESFMLCKTANIQPGETVLDPMCGCATFLIEGATIWSKAYYFGIDKSQSQLQKATANCHAASVTKLIDVKYGDARQLDHIDDNSIDKIISCPPFGRQFAMSSKNLYSELMTEWTRVLKPETGRMVILIDNENLNAISEAAMETAYCQVDFIRSPSFWLGKIQATVVILSKRNQDRTNKIMEESSSSGPPQTGKFVWEKTKKGNAAKGRSRWAHMRAEALGSLVPYSRVATRG